MGEIQVLVPRDMCVTTEADIGMGAFDVGDGEQGGVDLDVDEGGHVAPGVPELHLVADLGVGALFVGNSFFEHHGPGWTTTASTRSSPARTGSRAWRDGMTPRPGYDPASLIAGMIVILLGGLLLLDQADVLELARSTCCRPCSQRSAASCSPAGSPAPRASAPRRVGTSAVVTVDETQPAPLRRDRSRAIVGGVCAGIGRRSGVDPLVLRIGFVVAAAVGGLGVALYVLCWALIPADDGPGRALLARAAGRRESWMVASGLVLLVLALLLLFRAWGIWVGDAIVWPLILATGGGALIWRQSQGATVVEPAPREQARPGGGAGRPRRVLRIARPSLGIVVLGAVLVVAAALVFLWLNGALALDRDVALVAARRADRDDADPRARGGCGSCAA